MDGLRSKGSSGASDGVAVTVGFEPTIPFRV